MEGVSWTSDFARFLVAGLWYWLGFAALFLLDTLDAFDEYLKDPLRKLAERLPERLRVPSRFFDWRSSRWSPTMIRVVVYLVLVLGGFAAYRVVLMEARNAERALRQTLRDLEQDRGRLEGRLEAINAIQQAEDSRMEGLRVRLATADADNDRLLLANSELTSEISRLSRFRYFVYYEAGQSSPPFSATIFVQPNAVVSPYELRIACECDILAIDTTLGFKPPIGATIIKAPQKRRVAFTVQQPPVHPGHVIHVVIVSRTPIRNLAVFANGQLTQLPPNPEVKSQG